MLVRQLLLGVVLPALAAGAVLVAARQLGRHRRSRRCAWAGALGLGTGYVTGHLALFGWPGLAPTESWQWMSAVAAAVTLAAVLVASERVPRRVGWAFAVLVGAAASWLLVPPWQESRLAWTAALGGTAMALWIGSYALAKRTSVASPSLVVLIAASAAIVVLERAATAKFAQLAGALAASAGGCLLVKPLSSTAGMGSGLAGSGAVLLVGLMFTGYFHHFSDVPAVCFFLVAAAPLMAWLGQWAPIRRRKGWQRLVFEAAAVLAPAGVALALAFAATASNGHPPYGPSHTGGAYDRRTEEGFSGQRIATSRRGM